MLSFKQVWNRGVRCQLYYFNRGASMDSFGIPGVEVWFPELLSAWKMNLNGIEK